MRITSMSMSIMFIPISSRLVENEFHVRVTRILIFQSVLDSSSDLRLLNMILQERQPKALV